MAQVAEHPAGTPPLLEILADAEAVATRAADLVLAAARERLAPRDEFSIALAGGNTPRQLYRLLADRRDEAEFSRWRIFFGDERCVPADHPESNYAMARETLFDAVPIAADHVHRMEADADDLVGAAARYAGLLERYLPRSADGTPTLDFVLLGMGPDGHVASLFPGTAALDEERGLVAANAVPQLATQRMTLTFPTLRAARRILVLVTGAGKSERLREVLDPAAPETLPAQRLRGAAATWLIDRAASALLSF
jgi:6-phosphogluconolactonase